MVKVKASHHDSSERSTAVPILTALPSPHEFHAKYVAQREPVVIRNGWPSLLKSPTQDASAPSAIPTMPTVESLRSLVKETATIEVNHRPNDAASYSPAESRVEQMAWGDFLRHILDDNTNNHYYMTTQTLPIENEEGRPAICTTPVTELFGCTTNNILAAIPPRPALLGHLVPATWNVWIGKTAPPSTSSSSGWHHDYHDNLYCVWQGCKHLELLPPASILQRVSTVGTLSQLYPNGRIVYEEQGGSQQIRADGALVSVDRLHQLEQERDRILEEIEASETNCTGSRPTAKATKQDLEAQLERVEEEILSIEYEDDSEEEEEGDECQLFGATTTRPDEDSDEHNGVSRSDHQNPPSNKRAKLNEDGGDRYGEVSPNGHLPINFVTHMDEASLSPQTVSLSRGDLLYLPAGWFHNVSSSGGVHMAFNYWFHPPDAPSFDQPYLSTFWERDWAERFPSGSPRRSLHGDGASDQK